MTHATMKGDVLMEDIQKRIEAYIDSKRDEMLREWQSLVEDEAHCSELENTRRVARHIMRLFEESGVTCRLIEPHEDTPPVVYGVIGEGRQGGPVILSGHYDTVFREGWLKDHPFRIDRDGHAHGPGCLDMKGGIIIAAYVIRALEASGFSDRPVRIAFCGDEEAGPNHSYTGKVLQECARGCVAAFNMETGLPDGCLCTGRKGMAVGSFTTHGVSAHSGNAFEAGRNAIVEAAHKMIRLHGLTDLETGTHVNVAMVKGGLMINQVPDECTVQYSIRFKSMKEMDRTLQAVGELMKKTYIEGTVTEHHPSGGGGVFEETAENLALTDFISRISEKDGYGKVGHAFLGGGSDAPNLARYGAVTLCSCGIQGEWNHTDREYAIVESLFTRSKLWCDVIRHIGEFRP